MRLENYTSNAICRAMGLTGFVESDLPRPALRLLLKPSFDPEVCITLTGAGDALRLSVAVLTESLWLQPFPCRLLENSECVSVSQSPCADIVEAFRAAAASYKASIAIDGMPVESYFVNENEEIRFAGHAFHPAVARYVSQFIRLAWESCIGAATRNGLAACARYVGEQYAQVATPTKPLMSQILVVGTAEARSNFFRELRDHQSNR